MSDTTQNFIDGMMAEVERQSRGRTASGDALIVQLDVLRHALSLTYAATAAEPASPAERTDDVNAERKRFEQWYAETAFDYASTPIGSRDCLLQWRAWMAARDAAPAAERRGSTM